MPTFAQVLIAIARPLYASDPIDVDLDQSLYALDSTTIDLCLSLFPWAKFRKHSKAVTTIAETVNGREWSRALSLETPRRKSGMFFAGACIVGLEIFQEPEVSLQVYLGIRQVPTIRR